MPRDPHAVRALLQGSGFRRLVTVRVAGQCADGLFQAALFSAVFFDPTRQTSAAGAAVGFATLLLPYSLVGPFAGVLLDRWRRQRVLVAANAARALVVVVFAALLAVSGPTSPPVVVLALLVVSVNRFVLSGLSAALPHVVDERRLVTANSLAVTLGGGAAALGGGAAVLLRELTGRSDAGAGRIALSAAALYLVAGAVARRIPADLLGPDDGPTDHGLADAARAVLHGLRQGAAHIRSRGPAARALAAMTAHRFFAGLSFVSILLLYTAQGAIHRGFRGLGEVVVASVAGGLAAALVTPRVTRRTGTQRWIVSVFAAAAAAELFFGAFTRHGPLLAASVVFGFAAQASKICVDTLVQESVDDDFRGRVFAVYDTLFNVGFVGAAALAALIVPRNGRSAVVIAVVAGGYATTALVYALATARRSPGEPAEPIRSPAGP